MHGHAFGMPWVKHLDGSALWTPADDSPQFWVDTPAARTNNRLFTTSTKVAAATALTDPVGAIVQEGGIGFDLIQATGTRRYTLSQMTDGQWAVASDGVDDCLLNSTLALSAGAKTLGLRIEYSTTHTGSDIDVPITIGGSTSSFRLYLTGTASGSKGLSFVADLGATVMSRRYSGLTTALGVPLTIIIAYNGGTNTTTANYRLFIDGVEVTIDTTGATMGGGVNTALLALTVGSAPLFGKLSKAFVVTGDKSSIVADMHAYLVRALCSTSTVFTSPAAQRTPRLSRWPSIRWPLAGSDSFRRRVPRRCSSPPGSTPSRSSASWSPCWAPWLLLCGFAGMPSGFRCLPRRVKWWSTKTRSFLEIHRLPS